MGLTPASTNRLWQEVAARVHARGAGTAGAGTAVDACEEGLIASEAGGGETTSESGTTKRD